MYKHHQVNHTGLRTSAWTRRLQAHEFSGSAHDVLKLTQVGFRKQVQYFRVTGARVTVRHIPTQRVSLERPRLLQDAFLPSVCQCDDLFLLLLPSPLAGTPLACVTHSEKDPVVVAPVQSYVVQEVLAVVAGNEFDEPHNVGRHCWRRVWQRWNRVAIGGRHNCQAQTIF